MTYKQLKTGQAFRFTVDGAVFVRCRGGFRPGCGGYLYKIEPNTPVFLYQSFSE